MTRLALKLALASIVLLAPACAVALVGAGAAVGVWVYDETSNASGQMVIGHSPSRIFQECQALGRERGQEMQVFDAAMRVEFRFDDANVVMLVIVVPEDENAGILRVRARSTLRGREELAKELALEVQDRLNARFPSSGSR